MAKYVNNEDADLSELLIAEFKSESQEEIDIYLANYLDHFTERGFSFNEGFILMKLGFLQNQIEQLAQGIFSIQTKLFQDKDSNQEENDG